jgi:hypothetical protein
MGAAALPPLPSNAWARRAVQMQGAAPSLTGNVLYRPPQIRPMRSRRRLLDAPAVQPQAMEAAPASPTTATYLTRGGSAGIDSTPGSGTEVAILLPRNTEPVCRASAPPMEDAEAGFGKTVQGVEDDALVRAALAETLRDLRYQIIDAADLLRHVQRRVAWSRAPRQESPQHPGKRSDSVISGRCLTSIRRTGGCVPGCPAPGPWQSAAR